MTKNIGSDMLRNNDASPLGTLLGLTGSNFSGRTKYLEHLTASSSKDQKSIYIGSDIYNSISGLAATVYDELLLHSSEITFPTLILDFIEKSGIKSLFNRNPFEVSGGEQACITIISAMLLDPCSLAIDCALEQLDNDNKLLIINLVKDLRKTIGTTIIADNRINEIKSHFPKVINPPKEYLQDANIKFVASQIDSKCFYYLKDITPHSIKISNLHYKYDSGPKVFDNVNMELEPGNIYFLEGPNGAGKSTLGKLLSGILRPRKGLIYANNLEIYPWKTPGKLFSYHFQHPDLQLFATSIGEEISLSIKHLELSKKEGNNYLSNVLESFGLKELHNRHPLDQSFTVRKRIALAVTFAMNRSWVILDEPTLGQDDTTSIEIAKIITVLSKQGVGILLISHSQWFKNLFTGYSVSIDKYKSVTVKKTQGGINHALW